ncbi:hypothetical protein IB238_17985 [Rhizobium sp. ARZ01]|uniref:hypothetical protein n=1 Tax=Rhizobium sp. ARZ01 TaxID=2769313 RepID=UPI00178174F2|nr:hypothetical protein [Rhizobium sp. ARZ01]MBD9374516.1 hypothetical protein [Rhizobium sp. ARZ01]
MAGIETKTIEGETYEPRGALRTFAEALDKVGVCLGNLDAFIEPVRTSFDPKDLSVSFDQLARRTPEALDHARNAQVAIGDERAASALQSVLALIRTVHSDITTPEIQDNITGDLKRLIADPKSRHGPGSELDKAVDDLDNVLSELSEAVGDLLDTVIKLVPDLTGSARPVSRETNEQPAAEAIRDLAVMMASFQTVSARPTETGRASGRFETVSDQMMATLDAFSLPHDGVQFGHEDKVEVARNRLIDGLMRNFAWKERDGFRVYYRTDAVPAHSTAEPSQLLRGDALVSATMLRSDADALVATIARLPAMNRFETVRGLFDPAAMRRRIKDELDSLVETARDPLGINRARANFQFRRVVRTILEYLELGEIHTVANWPSRFESNNPHDLIGELAGVIDSDLMAPPVSAVREEEVTAELRAIFRLLCSIGSRVLLVQEGAQRGVNAARLELALTATLGAAIALEDQLERTGTDAIEQDLQFVPAQEGSSGTVGLSLGQFLGWVRAVAEPFARPENSAANLYSEDLKILRGELLSLKEAAGLFVSDANVLRFSVRLLPGPLRQLIELKYLLDKAFQAADAMASASA